MKEGEEDAPVRQQPTKPGFNDERVADCKLVLTPEDPSAPLSSSSSAPPATKSIFVEKALLSDASPYFKRLFFGGLKEEGEKEVTIALHPDDFPYFEDMTPSSDVFELVRLGDQFHLESIIEGCVDLINTALELDLDILKTILMRESRVFPDKFKAFHAKGTAYLADFVSKAQGRILLSKPAFYELPHFFMVEFLCHPRLQLRTENEFAFIIFEYISTQQRVEEDLEALVRMIDFSALSPYYLLQIIPAYLEAHKSLFKDGFVDECKAKLAAATASTLVAHLNPSPEWLIAVHDNAYAEFYSKYPNCNPPLQKTFRYDPLKEVGIRFDVNKALVLQAPPLVAQGLHKFMAHGYVFFPSIFHTANGVVYAAAQVCPAFGIPKLPFFKDVKWEVYFRFYGQGMAAVLLKVVTSFSDFNQRVPIKHPQLTMFLIQTCKADKFFVDVMIYPKRE